MTGLWNADQQIKTSTTIENCIRSTTNEDHTGLGAHNSREEHEDTCPSEINISSGLSLILLLE